jgi:uncharacterized sulfatase
MNRRQFLGAAAATLACTTRVPAAQATTKPNILFIIGDDMSWHDCGAWGSKQVRTPNIDKLAREGVRFTRCFAATAMCSPLRQTIYTGLFPVRSGAYPNHAVVRPGIRSVGHYLGELGYAVAISGKRHYGPPDSYPMTKLGDKIDYKQMEGFLAANKDRPFALFVCSNEPHSPWNQGDRTQYPPEQIELPPYLVDTPEMRASMSRYFAEITFLDGQLGRTLQILEATGRAKDTLVVFCSEQGSSFAHGKWTLYDVGLRSDIIARWPGRIAPGTTNEAMIQHCDLLPTWMELAGAKPPATLDGRSFAAALLGKTQKHRDVVFGVHTTRGIIDGSDCYPIRSVRDDRYKYIRNLNAKVKFSNVVTQKGGEHFQSWREKAKTDPDAAAKVRAYEQRPEEELYDLREDPWELKNVAADPALASVKQRLGKRLQAWMDQQGDRGIPTEMEALDHQNTDPNERKG